MLRLSRPFTVKVGTLFESSHVELHLWLQAIYLMRSTRKITVRQLQQELDVALKTAWTLSTRIREMIARDDGVLSKIAERGAVVEGEAMATAQGAGESTKVVSVGDHGTPVQTPGVGVANRELKRKDRERRIKRVQPDPRQTNLWGDD